MPIDADLGTIELKTSEKTETVESDVIKIESFDEDKKKKLDAEFAKSEVGKSLKTKLDAIKSDVNKTVEGKKNDMVAFLKVFFEVGDEKDDQIKRFVIDGKSYLRIKYNKKKFDIELSDDKMSALVERFLTTSESHINEGVTKEEDKIKLKYEKEKEFIKKTQAELSALKGQVTTPEAQKKGSRRERVTQKRNEFKEDWDFDKARKGLKGIGRDLVSKVTGVGTGIVGARASMTKMFGKKDPTNEAEVEVKKGGLIATITGIKDKVMDYFRDDDVATTPIASTDATSTTVTAPSTPTTPTVPPVA